MTSYLRLDKYHKLNSKYVVLSAARLELDDKVANFVPVEEADRYVVFWSTPIHFTTRTHTNCVSC